MTPQENLRRALLNDEFPEDTAQDRLFTPSGADALRTNRNIALSAWMTQVSGQDINAGSATWQHDKDALAQGFFKMPNARNVTDEQLHGMVRSHIQTAEEAATLAADGALTGEPLPSVIAAVRGKRGASQLRPIFDRYEQDAMRRHTALAVKLAPYRPLVNQVAGDLKKTMEGPDALTPAFEAAAERLLSVPAEDRRLVLQAIGATGGKDAKERASTLQKMAVAMDRMLESVVMSSAEKAADIALGGILSPLEGQEPDTVMPDYKNDELRLLTQQIRTVADQEIDPIKGDGWWSQTGIDIARMVPQSAVTIANPALGMAANYAYFENTIAGEAMLQDPRLTPDQARSIAGVSAPLNAAVATVTALIPFGRVKLPFVQKWLQATATSLPTTAARFGVRAAAGTDAEIGEEYIQAWTPLKAQELLGALQKDMPGVDWENRMPKFSEIAAQTWGPALVFSLVSAGSVSISEVNGGRALASDVDLMVAQGLAPARAQSIATAAESNNWQQVDALFRDDFVKPEKATDTEKAEAAQRFLAKIQAQRQVEEANNKEASQIGVRVFRDAQGWKVETAGGNVVNADSAEAARRIRDDLKMSATEYEAETMVSMVDDMIAARPGTRIEIRPEVAIATSEGIEFTNPITGKTVKISDSKSFQNLRDQAEAIDGQSPDLRQSARLILGDNYVELGEGIARVFRRARGPDAVPQAITAAHEVIENSFRRGLSDKLWSEQDARNAIGALIPALESGIARLGAKATAQEKQWLDNAKRAVAEGDSNLVREVISEMGVRAWIGRDRDGNKTGLRPGTILRALDAAILQEAKPENVTTYQRLRAWFKAVGAYLKGVVATANIIRSAERDGTIDDFTGFLDKVLGIETATREENEVKDGVIDMAFSLAPDLRSSSQGYLGAVSEDGEVKIKSADLATDTHESSNLDPRNDGVGTFRYRKDNETLYWHFAPSEIRKESAIAALERKGFKVAKSKVISFGSEDSLIAHGLDRALVKGSTFSLAPTEQDREYLELAKDPEKNRSLLQRMVDAAAKAAGYVTKVYHGGADITEFNVFPMFLSPYEKVAQSYADDRAASGVKAKLHKVFINAKNPATGEQVINAAKAQGVEGFLGEDSPPHEFLSPSMVGREESKKVALQLQREGFDSARTDGDFAMGDSFTEYDSWTIFNPTQIKSADPVTYDESGNVIPLSQRFNQASPDIRYSLSPITPAQDAEYLALAKEPEKNRTLLQKMVDAVAKAAGYNVGPVFHGTRADFTSFDSSKHKGLADAFYHFGDESAAMARIKGKGKILRVYLQARKPIRLEDPGYWMGENLSESLEKSGIYIKPEDADDDTAAKAIRKAGFDSIIYRNDTEGGDSYAVFSPSQIKSADPVTYDESGNVIPLSQRFNQASPDIRYSLSPVTPARDAEYSVEAFHGTDSGKFDQFDILKLGKGSGNEGLFSAGFYFSPSSDNAKSYGKHLVSVGLKIKNPLIVPDSFPVMMRGDDSAEYWAGFETQMREALRSVFEANNFNDVGRIDAVQMDESFIGSFARAYKALTGMGLPPPKAAEVSANLIKRAGFDAVYAKDGDTTTEIVVYDPANILIKNWNGKSINSTFSLSPQSGIDIVSDTLESWQDVFDKAAKRNPTRAMAIRDLAQQRINRLGEMWAADRWTAKGDKIRAVVEKRTKGSLDDEQAMREALRYQELLDAGMMTLTPQTLMAWSEGVDKLQNDPLVRAMLANGRLMSKATAERAGKLKTDGKGNAGDYDGAPWIPPQWYSKDAGHMPDTMAQTLYDEGILGDPSVDTLWAELEKAIKTNRAAKESYAKAEEAVKSIEKEARSQAKAEAAAWRQESDDMQADDWSPRESLVRDMRVLNVALSAFPPEVRAKVTGGSMVKLAGLATERARYKAIQTALEKAIVETERFMRKEYTEQIDDLLDTYRSQKDSSGRISGKLPSQYTELVDYAYRIREMDIEAQATEGDGLEKSLEKSESDEETQRILTKMGILRLFETWDTKDSAAMAAASEWLSDTIESGKLGRKLLDEDRKAMLDDFRATAKKDAVPEGKISKVDVDNETNQIRFKVFRRAWQGLNGMLDSAIHTLGQRLELVFGEDSKITDHFITSFIRAANESNDIKRGVNAKYHDMLSVVFNSRSRLAHARGIGQMQKVKASGIMITEGRKVKEVKLDIETLTKLADGDMTAEAAGLRQDQVDAALEEWAASERKRTVTVEVVENAGEQKGRDMTELQGVQWWLWSRQDASRKQMERDGWTEESFKQLDAFLSPEAKALGEWITKGYDDAARLIDPVYRRLFNAPLPRVKNYAPIYRNRSGDASVMDLDASDISSGLAAGFTKSRVNTVSPLAEMDAVTVMLTHWENVAHWVTHAEAVRDAKAVLLDRDVMTAIKQSSGNVSANSVKQRIAAIESQGTNAARELVDLSRMWRWIMQYRAFKGLAFRMSPVIKQTPALLNPLLADVPAHSYTMGLARAFYDPAAFGRDVAEMFKSDTIMRRIEGGFSAEARIAMQGEGAMGSVALAWMQKGMMPMAWTDAGWTALGAAVSFDYYKRGYISEGMNEAMANAAATKRLEKMIAVSAQPSDIVNRSLVEASSNNFMRSLWMFASDQRKALGIEVTALKKLLSGKSKNKAMDVQRILVAHVAQAAMSQLMASWMASLIGDDDDKEREWSREQWTLSLALGPINGLFVFGRLIDMAGRRILGLRIFPGGNLVEKAADDLVRGGKSMDELFNPDDPEDFINALDALSVGASGVMTLGIGPQAGVIDVTANLVREGNKIIKAATEEE